MTPETRIGLKRGDGGPRWGLSEIVKTHLITSLLYPFGIVASLAHNPRAALKELLTEGPGPSYKAMYKQMAEMSVYWTPPR